MKKKSIRTSVLRSAAPGSQRDEGLDLARVERCDLLHALQLAVGGYAPFDEDAGADLTKTEADRAFDELLKLASRRPGSGAVVTVIS